MYHWEVLIYSDRIMSNASCPRDPWLTNHHIHKYCHFHLAHCPYHFFSHQSTSNQHMSPILEKSGFLTRKWWLPHIAILSCRFFWMEPRLKTWSMKCWSSSCYLCWVMLTINQNGIYMEHVFLSIRLAVEEPPPYLPWLFPSKRGW